MSDLMNLYIYYDRMSEYYYFKPWDTETDMAKYHQFIQLRDAVAREIETRYA